MKEIPLTQGRVAIVDDEDYERVSQYKWSYTKQKRMEIGYAVKGHGTKAEGRIEMHRFILPAPPGLEVDHINRNGLDNRRSNLRLATRSQQNHNRRKPRIPTTSQYKGVSFWRRQGKWVAQIKVEGSRKYIGAFNTEIEAARAFDREAKKLLGDFAVLNFPDVA